MPGFPKCMLEKFRPQSFSPKLCISGRFGRVRLHEAFLRTGYDFFLEKLGWFLFAADPRPVSVPSPAGGGTETARSFFYRLIGDRRPGSVVRQPPYEITATDCIHDPVANPYRHHSSITGGAPCRPARGPNGRALYAGRGATAAVHRRRCPDRAQPAGEPGLAPLASPRTRNPAGRTDNARAVPAPGTTPTFNLFDRAGCVTPRP